MNDGITTIPGAIPESRPQKNYPKMAGHKRKRKWSTVLAARGTQIWSIITLNQPTAESPKAIQDIIQSRCAIIFLYLNKTFSVNPRIHSGASPEITPRKIRDLIPGTIKNTYCSCLAFSR